LSKREECPNGQKSLKETTRSGGDRPQELEILIRERAYALYEERGREDGHAVEDWLRAEQEIMEQEVRPKAA
jgi:Protein of unknown function (DUF2934)